MEPMTFDQLQQNLSDAIRDALGDLTLADVIDSGGNQAWLLCELNCETGDWTVSGTFGGPGDAYEPPDGEIWIDLGVEPDSHEVSGVDDDVRDEMARELGLSADELADRLADDESLQDQLSERCWRAYEDIGELDRWDHPDEINFAAELAGEDELRRAYKHLLIYTVESPDTSARALAALARDEDPDVRAAVAQNPSTPARALAALARDESWEVREAVAQNPGTSARALAALARDEDADVRLAAQFARRERARARDTDRDR